MTGELNDWIWDTMLSMTLLMLLVLAIRKPVSHFFGARIAYLLWILPLARLFMPTLTLEAPAEVGPAIAFVPTVPTAAGSELVASVPAQSSAFAALASLDWMMIALILWLGGAGLLFISKLASYLQFREDIVADGHLIGRHDNIKILETAAVGGPLAFGLFEKYIAVPTNFFRDYAPRERELALEHEIAHHDSGDLAANFVGLTILSLHWFNPVAWFAWIAFRQDQETACDARVLAQSGRDVRAVYGRTIAKSASGHRLGLASPLNQKDKIKGRLKMLGQAEKSTFRSRLGAGMVAIGTITALPLTATVTYAEAVDPVEPVDMMIPDAPSAPTAPVPPAAPLAPLAPVAPDADDVTNITMLNGRKNYDPADDYVHRIKHNGRTIVLRTNKQLSEKEIRKMVAEAERSRLEAEKALREGEMDRQQQQSIMSEIDRDWAQVEQEMQQELREARQEVVESQQEAREAKIEAWNDAREAQREATQDAREARREALQDAREAQREAREAAREARSSSRSNSSNSAARMTSISYTTSGKISGPDCTAMNKQIAMAGTDSLTGQAWAVVAGCGGFTVKVDKTAVLKAALADLEKGRIEAAKCKDSQADRARKLKEFDRSIAKVKAQLSMT
ncbi:M56 family metallopeptidase [Parasphingorhabdus sp.]|uniref:M56 family metallopeptidase n=1 Tax=Parasphingorhabdus sp. TaxID=2709688 RepID=UPI003A8F6F2D